MLGEAALQNPAIFGLCGAESRALGWKESEGENPPELPNLQPRVRQRMRQRWRLWQLAKEYILLAERHPPPEPIAYACGHIRWMLGKKKAGSGSRSVYTHCGKFEGDQEGLRAALDSASDLEQLRSILDLTLGYNFK